MIIVYIAFGIASGMVAATVTLWAGAGLFPAVVAYIIAGMAGMMTGAILVTAPEQAKPVKQALTQRS